ncbi:MAG: hypothetical protein EBT50_03560 [Verrucomicrobia bacterium]|nr:hypothetical protein [Verrucomicrobiota bacterium]
MAPFGNLPHPSEPLGPGSAQKLHQHRLGLVVRLMGQPKLPVFPDPHRLLKKFPPGFPGLPLTRSARLNGPPRHHLEFSFLSPSLHPTGIGIRGPSTPTMVEMKKRRLCPQAPQGFRQNHAVGPSRKPHRHLGSGRQPAMDRLHDPCPGPLAGGALLPHS